MNTQPQWRQQLVNRLVADPLSHATVQGDHLVAGVPPEPGPFCPAAVLIGLIERPVGLTLLLTRRTEHLLHHPGQISFPGGRSETHDADPVVTALREAEEEIGLDPTSVEILGYLPCYQTITGFMITPVIGYLAQPPRLQPDPYEVAEVFEVPLEFILDPANHQRHSRQVQGTCRYYYVLPYQNYMIWGATAAMLVELARRLK